MQRGPLVGLKHSGYPKSYISVSCTDARFKNKETQKNILHTHINPDWMFLSVHEYLFFITCVQTLGSFTEFKADINDSYLDG